MGGGRASRDFDAEARTRLGRPAGNRSCFSQERRPRGCKLGGVQASRVARKKVNDEPCSITNLWNSLEPSGEGRVGPGLEAAGRTNTKTCITRHARPHKRSLKEELHTIARTYTALQSSSDGTCD